MSSIVPSTFTAFAEALGEDPSALRPLLDAWPTGLLVVTSNADIAVANQWFEHAVGSDDIEGCSLESLVEPEDREALSTAVARLVAGRDSSLVVQLRYLKTGAQPFWSETSLTAMVGKSGSVRYLSVLVTDAGERRRAEIELRGSQDRLHALINAEPACVKTVARDGVLLGMNPMGVAIVGYQSIEELAGQSVYTLIEPLYRARYKAFNERVCDGFRGSMVYQITTLDGSVRWMQTYAVPFYDAELGDTVQLAVSHDITEDKSIREQLEHSEEKYRQIFANESDAILLSDKESRQIIDANPAALSLYGYSWQKATQLELLDFSAEPAASLEVISSIKPGLPMVINERLLRRSDGSTFSAELVLSSFLLGGQQVLISIVRDISERLQTSSALTASERRFRDFASIAADWFWETDSDYRFTYQSERFAEITGIRAETVIGKTREEAFEGHIDSAENWTRQFDDMLNERNYKLEWSITLADGSQRHLQTIGKPIFNTAGEFQGYRGVGRDVTAARAAQNRMELLIDELEAKNAELEQFVYTASHDLKSPLLTIKSFIGLLERDIREQRVECVRADLRHIVTATERMQVLLQDLLELSRVRWVPADSQWFSLGELTQEVVEQIRARIESSGAQVVIHEALPQVFGDRTRFLQVLQNLIENGIKFCDATRSASIEVGAREDDGERVIYVKDKGPGVEPRFHDRIFRLFERLGAEEDGSGVGLALVKRIVEDRGGRVWVESEGSGDGSCFCFTVPAPDDAALVQHRG